MSEYYNFARKELNDLISTYYHLKNLISELTDYIDDERKSIEYQYNKIVNDFMSKGNSKDDSEKEAAAYYDSMINDLQPMYDDLELYIKDSEKTYKTIKIFEYFIEGCKNAER